MNSAQLDIYKMTAAREKALWEGAIFVFDSSALLDFYFLPLPTRKKVFDELFLLKLKDRLWIPSHVRFEYEKNREKIIKKPIFDKYRPLKDENLKAIRTSIKDISTRVEDLKNKTKKEDKHPHLKQIEIEQFLEIVQEFRKSAESFEDAISKQISSIEAEIERLPENDDVAKAVESMFQIGRYFSFEEIIEITREGKHRYEFSIPPGYEDLKEKDKKGTQIFGDLIIWKQIMEFALDTKKPIVFICNDLKEDWCHTDKSATEKRIESPREELIKEIYDHSGIEFWMYNQPQFLHLANVYFQAEIEPASIQTLAQILNSNTSDWDDIEFYCKRCNRVLNYHEDEVELDFECVGGSERNMGTENQYQANVYFQCQCGNEICATFEVWEYPIGAQNYQSVELDGGELIHCFPFGIDFQEEQEPDRCAKCGAQFYDNGNTGVCEKCEEAYNDDGEAFT